MTPSILQNATIPDGYTRAMVAIDYDRTHPYDGRLLRCNECFSLVMEVDYKSHSEFHLKQANWQLSVEERLTCELSR